MSMLIRREQVERLSHIESGESLVISCYLHTDGKHQTDDDYQITLKHLIKQAREDLEGRELSDEVRKSAEGDLDRIRSYVEGEFDRNGTRGLAIFACGPCGVWEIFPLPRPLPSRLVVDHSPYLRPLTVLLDEHPRFCAVLVDREKARIFEIYQGEIEETTELLDEVPDQVRYGGDRQRGPGHDQHGTREGQISRHIEDHVHRHYKNTADTLFDIWRKERFDFLLVGGHREALNEFTQHLHSYLQERLRSTIEADLQDSASTVLDTVRQVEQEVERENEARLMERLRTEAKKKGMAVLGIEATLEALHRGAVHTLVVDNEKQASGWRCRDCRRMTASEGACPSCRREEMEEIPHLIDQAIEEAILQGSEIEHIIEGAGFEGDGPLAAILRFRLEQGVQG